MKKTTTLLLVLACSALHAQKEDHTWLVSHVYGLPDATTIDFNQSPAQINVVQRDMYLFGTNASICDGEGNLLLYTNGLAVAAPDGGIIQNGDSLNYGSWATMAGNLGYNIPQGAFFIQKPSSPHLYYLFHMYLDWIPNGATYTKFYYSLIDLEPDSVAGAVVAKNVPLLEGDDLLNYDQAVAVRHANGRDWWIVVSNHMGPEYFLFLLSPSGIEGPWSQQIGFKEPTSDYLDYGHGQRVFSPDGTKLVDYDFDNYTQVFDFDRCSGLLSNAKLIEHTIDPGLNNGAAGAAFSPSGRFLYLTTTDNGHSLLQFDMAADDLLASQVVVHHCPLVNQQFECTLPNMLLAPDGKVYVGRTGDASFGIVHKPDSLGAACAFEPDGLVFPLAFPNGVFPYWPNYRLGELEGSGCDTIVSGVAEYAVPKGISLSPNPAAGRVRVVLPAPVQGPAAWVLHDRLGREVLREALPAGGLEAEVSLAGLPPGLYLWALEAGGRMAANGKLVVVP